MSGPSLQLEPIVLDGPRLTLEPLAESHLDGLERLFHPEIWKWYTVQLASPAELREFMRDQLEDQLRGKSVCFAIRVKPTGELIGATRYMSVDRGNLRLEIGSTWYAIPWQRTFANTEAKFLLFSHAFEKLGCIAVELRTDVLNERSCRAIERLGAKRDGTLRSHRICRDGRIRDSAVYSVIRSEWPAVRGQLLKRMS